METRDREWVICPHCGYKHGDSQEWCGGYDFIAPRDDKCDECGKPFQCWAEYDVTYHAKPAAEPGPPIDEMMKEALNEDQTT